MNREQALKLTGKTVNIICDRYVPINRRNRENDSLHYYPSNVTGKIVRVNTKSIRMQVGGECEFTIMLKNINKCKLLDTFESGGKIITFTQIIE